MIDFFKGKVKNINLLSIRNNPLLTWDHKVNDVTGEIKESTAYFHNIKFRIVANKYLYISGSLHKLWNNMNARGNQNYNDFEFTGIRETITIFCELFSLHPKNIILENLEFGVNVSPAIPVNEILQSVIVHKWKSFTQEYDENKYFRECEHRRYRDKFYNKGLQYGQYNLLRFEVKIVKMIHIKKTEIRTLNDLTDSSKICRLGAILTANFNELLFYDHSINVAKLNERERIILIEGRIPNYWNDLLKSNPNNYHKKRNRFKELVQKHGTQNIHETIGLLILQKWNDLLNKQTVQDLTDPLNMESTGINLSSIGLIPVSLETKEEQPPRRYCLSCGRDITNQKKGSKFCSAKYMGEQYAHKCRNDDSNIRNRIKYMKERERATGTLFDTTPFYIKVAI